MHTIKFGNTAITYSVTKSKRRKTSQIIVDDKGVEIRTPITKTDSEIKRIVSGKLEWIFKKQLEFEDKQNRTPAKIKPKTVQYLEKRVWTMASKMDLKPPRVIVKNLKSRWGSCAKNGTIAINAALTKAPPPVIDYIVVHELCHLKIPDHSWRFWSLVSRYCKNYKQQIQWLESSSRSIL